MGLAQIIYRAINLSNINTLLLHLDDSLVCKMKTINFFYLANIPNTPARACSWEKHLFKVYSPLFHSLYDGSSTF